MHQHIVYLASPYSAQPCRAVAEAQATEAVAKLARHGVTAVSPVTLGCAMQRADEAINAHWSHGDWLTWCLPLIQRADALVVLALEGWETSVGVKAEMAAAARNCVSVVIWRADMTADDVVAHLDARRAAA